MKLLLFSLISFLTGSASEPGQRHGPAGADLLFAGDAMQHQAQLDQALSEGGGKEYDYSGCFDLIAPDIIQADYAVVNLEVPLGGGPRYSGYPCFSAPDSYARALADAGFDLFLTANNHCLDSGMKAARRTISALDSLGVDHTGTFHDAADRCAKGPLIKEIHGIRFGFLNYTYGTNGIPVRDGMEVALLDRDAMARDIRESRTKGAEFVIVTVHWGIEYVLHENANQRSWADFLIEQGADMIIGSHPHVIQPMKLVRNETEGKDVLVVYSLGNFISNMKTSDTRGGALVKVRVERDAEGKPRLKKAVYDTLFSAKPTGTGSNFRVYPSRMSQLIPDAQQGHWTIFDRAARRIFDTCNVGVGPE